jgi:hypothetical protein
MTVKFKLDLIKKEVDKSEEYGVPVKETRWFVETNDGFDGTANGYGYKTPQAVCRAYSYFKNKDQRKAEFKIIQKFLKDNPDVRKMINNYMDADWVIDRQKDGEDSTIKNMIEIMKEKYPKGVEKLEENKNLWKLLLRY